MAVLVGAGFGSHDVQVLIVPRELFSTYVFIVTVGVFLRVRVSRPMFRSDPRFVRIVR